jgi:hypothetical protein
MPTKQSWGKLLLTLPLFEGYLDPSESGLVAQSVEQRTENPCVGGSIPS